MRIDNLRFAYGHFPSFFSNSKIIFFFTRSGDPKSKENWLFLHGWMDNAATFDLV